VSERSDSDALVALLAAQELSLVCQSRATAPLSGVDPAARALLARVEGQNRAHAIATRAALRRRGGRPAPAPRSDVAVNAELARHLIPGRLAALRGAGDALTLLVDVERAAIGAAYVAMSQISDGGLALLVAQMMACDAQHEALLEQARHPGAVAAAIPYGVVEGIA
jgi:hypothetical protein